MSTKHIIELLARYEKGECTEAEKALVEQWFEAHGAADSSFEQMDSDEQQKWVAALFKDINQQNEIKAIPPVKRLWPRIAVAAAAVAVMTLGVWLYYASSINGRHPDAGQDPGSAQYANDIAPGKNGATITLGNGRVIQLSDAKSGVVVGNGKIFYSSLRGGDPSLRSGQAAQPHDEIASIPRNDGVGENSMMLTASTTRGQTYQFTLPDGTKVWLNADSKISFPSQFSGRERKILLEGEAYFEVSKDKAHPFIVQSDGQQVTVLGTHFNINAYRGEGNIKTTLLEGSVRLTNHSAVNGRHPELVLGPRTSEILLKPNQQATNTGAAIKVEAVNAADAIAWKSGRFAFNRASLEAVLHEMSRWYNVDVKYPDGIPDEQFTGNINRNNTLAQALDILKFMKVKFEIQGRTIVVKK
ncbi:FecR family protein [Pedobacter ginsengisoli]|uniref:FecR family protein n=1 Tax=Pedobacter ginsengisoli TaxID=363852 RepID=UPI00254D522F|nr:FecR family protein [Pedobacter ginsengisoli]